ncbi:hypothetical protein Vafri_9024 [Volvox africanus]|uniref:Fibrocystin-L n=1 Tax=Volvox africanus TaxID=51714 RepID=A0A8J4B3M3_9CHLO|nr:hypothetical protein Vafri_9024 [Volvox africanus]
MTILSALLLIIALAFLRESLGDTSIDSIVPSYGSTAGGTRLSIFGTGFGDMYSEPATVFVGSYPCSVIMHLSSSEVLTCETSSGLVGTYFVYVSISGADPVSYYGFTYSDNYSPTFKTAYPYAGPPGTAMKLYGEATWQLQYSDCAAKKWGDIECVGSILFGDYLCRQDPSISGTGINFTYGTQRYGSYLYTIGCTLPTPDESNNQPALATAKNLNTSIHFEASMRGGMPRALRYSYHYTVDGTPYQFQLYPEVTGVSPAVGSNAGGTLLRISGRGFSDLGLGLGDTVNVSTAGVPCSVVNSTYDTIFCITGPKAAQPSVTSNAVNGLYPGMRGVEYEFYNMTTQSLSYGDLWKLNKTVLLSNAPGIGSYKTVLTGAMESIHYETSAYCSLLKAFFIAPRTANYTFYMQADDFGRMNGTYRNTTSGIVMTRALIEEKSWSYLDNYFLQPSQASLPLPLDAGQPILLESAHCNGPSVGMQQVAVRMEVPTPQANSIAEQQIITVNSILVARSLAIKYLYGAGAGSATFTINVTSTNDSKLNSTSLGLELTLGTNETRVVVLPLLATGLEMTTLIEVAFGGKYSLGSNGTTFGVYKSVIPRLLTVQIGIDSRLATALGFTVSAARLVIMPTPAPYVVASCNQSDSTRRLLASATDATSSTAGMVVILEQARSVAAVTPGGFFQLRRASRTDVVALSYDTNATIMWSAIHNLTSLENAVVVTSVRREGAFLVRVWNVTFPISAFNTVPDLVAETNDRTPDGVDLDIEVRGANPPVTGSFWVAFGSNCGSVQISLTDVSETVRTKLASLPGLTAPQSVSISGGPSYGYTYTITFDPIGNPGNQPSLRVTNTSGLKGIGANASIATAVDGSTDAFYAPIPTEFLRLAVAKPGTISLQVNGVPSACADASGICGFLYSDAATPHITGVSPTALSFISQSTLPITITGSGFRDGPTVEVRVGTALCNVTSVTATQIVCDVPDTAPAGIRLVTVNVEGLGFADGAVNITLETLYVTDSAPSPTVVSSTGFSVLNFTGKGFDYVNCANNRFEIDGVPCGIVACGTHFLTVVYPGDGGADVPTANVTARVYEKSQQIDFDTPSNVSVLISGSAPTISTISPAHMPGCGGVVTLELTGTTASEVTTVFMVPYISSLLNYTEASEAYNARVPCTDVAAGATGTITCSSPPLRNGRYHTLVVLSSGLQLLSIDTIRFEFFITSVSPNLGSIGGGTLVTITGSGFSQNVKGNAVFMTVPVSSTFLNGIIECETQSVTTTTLTCRTLPSMATNADVDDPRASKVMPVATQPRPISVVLCDPQYNTTILRGYCWSLTETPRANCAASDPTDCSFGYATNLTPEIEGTAPSSGYFGGGVSVHGTYMDTITVVQFLQDGDVKGNGTNVDASYSVVSCSVPDMRPGVYTVRLLKANGEMSVDPYHLGVFTYIAVIRDLENNVGSLAGGLALGITVGGAGLAVNAVDNQVTIAGLPCPIVSVENRTHLTCRAPAINGYVYAEYWNLGYNTNSMPDLISFTDPLVTRLEKGLDISWYGNSPLPGTIQSDFFGARFTFYYQIAETENVTFRVDADDLALLYIDDLLLGSQNKDLNIGLTAGVHKIVATFVEFTGWAGVHLKVALTSNGSMGSYSVVEWQKVTPVQPGLALPVELTVNGVKSDRKCPSSTKVLQLTNQPVLSWEPTELALSYGTCGFIYTTYRTPALATLNPLTLSGITVPSFNSLNSTLNIYGNFLTDSSLPAADQIHVTVANRSCNIVSAVQIKYNSINATNITCTVPSVPAGTWSVSIMVDGLGLTRPTATASTDLPIVTYPIKVLRYNSPTVNSNPICYFSLFGGGTFNVSGYGFVKGLVDTNLQVNMTAAWEASPCGYGYTNTPTCQAVLNSSRMNLIPIASDGPTAVFQLTRFKVSNPEAYAGNLSTSLSSVILRYKPRVYYMINNTFVTTTGSENLFFCGGRTPALSGVAPSSPAPDAGANLTLSWYLAGVGSQNNTITASAVGVLSNATVEFEVGPTILSCAPPVVTGATISLTTYRESISCKMPVYMPAATYTLWLCIQPFGCGLLPSYTVPLTVSATSATTGSSAGGISVVITGKGFDTNTTLVSARFGNSTCKITSSSATSVTCLTGPLDSKPTSTVTWPLSITSTLGTSEITFPSFTFTFDPALEASVTSIIPARGSTEGGTPVTITGADFRTGVSTTVTIGDITCQSVIVVNSTTITCTTAKPPANILRVPLPVTVLQQGYGYARSSIQYQYIDVWSRNSTWGGGPLPGYEDSVVIPAGRTVLLDISPPKLYVIVLEGNLIFDDTKEYINLQAHYIIVKGGNFTIGSAEKPYPGRANITMHGLPNSRDLPQYGAKALGVRTGLVSFYGQPKIPHYTKLNQTANVNDTYIIVNGAVNWQVGDRIVIASSSFMPWEVDEVIITALDNTTVPRCTVISLDTPLKYTHLGEIHNQDGVPMPLDMRAEVAVLTRNIVLQGDYTSAKYQYGVQVMVNTPSYLPTGLVRFDNIEITQSGQAFRLGRYSMHWHLLGDVAWQTWVRGCAIHHTYNRAITVHGTHRAIIQNVTAYHTMGHTFFLEDGIESMTLMDGNIAIYVKVSDALLNTDTTPGAFWLTNPNNTVRNNVAVGSHGYGFWYRMLDYPDGPSATTKVCPKFTPLLEFTNNTAHSNMFYGLRIHPEFYPRNIPCNGFYGVFQQMPAVFNGLVAYKNGVKGAVASQVGLVQFINMVMGDNGGGPKQHSISGKDHGASMEMTWVVDDRNRYDVKLTEMAGFQNCTIYARTNTGMQGTAAQWPSGRRITAIIAQSPVQGEPKHSALMSMINMTYVDFTADKPGFSVLEACGKCKVYQGGATTFTANTTYVQSDFSTPVLSLWSWGHQGIFLDTDGTLLNGKVFPDALWPDPFGNWTFGPGATWHSAVENDLFDPKECVYVRDVFTSNNGAYCSPALTFRRVMVHNHGPESLKYKNLNVVSLATNRTSVVHFTGYNEEGYQFTTATTRDYWLTWDMVLYRLDPEYYQLHKMELMNGSDYTYYSSKYVQRKDHFTVNSLKRNRTELPPAQPNTTHGDFFYNKTFDMNIWHWSNRTYNDTKFTVFLNGRLDDSLYVQSYACPDDGCTDLPPVVVDLRDGILYWSNFSTWNTSATNFHKPEAGDNVTIPYGWNLVIDESPPPLLALTIQGNVRFDPTRDINLTATYIIVQQDGVLSAGNATVPHPTKATVLLQGMRDTPDYAIDNNLNLGSKVLAALFGGTINLYGRQVLKRWIKLGSAARIGDNAVNVSNPNHGWNVGDKIIITPTSFNWKQSEIRTITIIRNNGSQLVLDSPLVHPHGARVKAYPGGPTVDMRAEVGLVSSNVMITAVDGESTHSFNGEMFGARVVIVGNSTGRFDNMGMSYCGQAGFNDRACMYFDRLAPVQVPRTDNVTNVTTLLTISNPSFLKSSVLIYGLASNVRVGSDKSKSSNPITLADNVMYEAYDMHSVDIYTRGNTIRGNLVIGTIKDMTGKAIFDVTMPSSFNILEAANWVTDNIAAGSERCGFTFYGPPCGDYTNGAFLNNTAHSSLVGLWYRASSESSDAGCTQLTNFTTYMNWDFGIISTRGISTNVILKNVNILDTKHAGIHLMRAGEMLEKGWMRWEGGLLAGQSSNDVCTACSTLSDPGCHPKLSSQSFNQLEPFTPAVGLQSAQFAVGFAIGPEKKPYDKPMGYSLVHGMLNISGITLADFLGKTGCGGSQTGTYALANQPKAPEVFYPHYFSNINVVNISVGVSQGLFYHTPPDPDWRNEADCGEAVYTRSDGSQILLNCAGPAHAYWRDLDGSLTGTVSTMVGIFTQKRVFPMDQGSPVLPGACTYSQVLNSYQCAVNSSSYVVEPGLDARYKPNPVPVDGIWGDPQMLVLESRDKDSEDRNFGPVFFNVSGSIDVVTTAMDHGWCFAYTCQKRLSTFWTYVPSGQTVYINFTGTPSQNFRIWFPYADPNKEVVLVFNMLYTLNRRFTWLPPGNGNATGRVMPSETPIKVGDGTPHGAYFWDQDNTLLYVKMKGGMVVETRTESAVMVSQSFAISIDNFYSQQTIFLKNLAYVMGIDMNRIYVAKIVAGSVTATLGIEPDKSIAVESLPESQYSATVDPNDPVLSSTVSPPPPSLPPPPPPPSTVSVLADLSALVDKFTAAILDPNATSSLGITPIGTPTVDWSGVAAAVPPPPPSSPPPSPPPPSSPTPSSPPPSSPPPSSPTPSSPPPSSPPPSSPTPSSPPPSSPPPSSPTPSSPPPSSPPPSSPTPSSPPPSSPPPSSPTPSSPPPSSPPPSSPTVLLPGGISIDTVPSPTSQSATQPPTSPPLLPGAVAPPPPLAVASPSPPVAPLTTNPEGGPGGNGGDGTPTPSNNDNSAGSTSKTGNDDRVLSRTAVIGIALGAVGGCLLLVAVSVLIVARSKSHKRLRPVSPPGALSTGEVSSSGSIPPTPVGGRPSSGVAREAFVVTNPAYETPAERAAASRNRGTSVPMQESLAAEVPVSPRSTALAAGPTPNCPPELLGPLGSPLPPVGPLSTTHRMPHSSLPLTVTPAPMNTETALSRHGTDTLSSTDNGAAIAATAGGADIAGRSPSDALGGSSRSPAQLTASSGPSDTAMKYAPNLATSAADWDAGSPEAEQLVDTGPKGAISGRPCSPGAPVTAGAFTAGGDTQVESLSRGLDTSESIAPRPKSRSSTSSRPLSANAGIRAGADNLSGNPDEGGVQGDAMEQQKGAGSHRQVEEPPMMMLPGGLMEYSATASLLRSEVAALVLAGGEGGPAATENGSGSEGGTTPRARTPAGLQSDSMRRRELP